MIFACAPRRGSARFETFSVGTLRDVAEVEPNNDFARPQTVGINVTVNGVAGNEDIDYYEVRAKKEEARITVEVEGIRLGLTLFRPLCRNLEFGRTIRTGLERRQRPHLAGWLRFARRAGNRPY